MTLDAPTLPGSTCLPGSDDAPDVRTLGEAIAWVLRARGIDADATFFVEDIFNDPLNVAATRALVAYDAADEAGQAARLEALVQALVIARSHEGWLALASSHPGDLTHDLAIESWIAVDTIDVQRQRIAVATTINRLRFRLWVSFDAAAYLVRDVANSVAVGIVSSRRHARSDPS